ncbi:MULTISPECIES: hypothetical protein [unclassified Streptomyces]|uniref:hypothetical protein n=1 Tax=unclassified Streptomyces TaxID=2593676 RepID=UPI0036E0367A
MSNADLLTEALDTAIHLGWALAGWVIFLGVVTSILILAAIATGTWAVRLAWRHTAAPTWARSRTRARLYARRTRRDYEEAA